MRKKIFSVVLLLMCAVMLLSACDLGNFGNGNDNIIAQSGRVPNRRYSTKKGDNPSEPIKSFYDDNYYYYYFYLGEISDVPLQEEYEYEQYTGTPYTVEFETTKTTATSVENSCTTAATKTTTWTSTASVNVGGTFEKILGFIDINLELGFSMSTGRTQSQCRTDSYTAVATKSESATKKAKFEFTKDSQIGYYRYIMTGVVKVYTVAIYSIEENAYYLETLTEVVNSGYSFDYSTSPTFDDNNYGSLEFDYSAVNNLKAPTEPLYPDEPLKPSRNIVENNKNVCKNSTKYTVTETGVYGLAQKSYDTINLEKFSKYFDGDYLFRFAVTLNVSKIDNGYQEIYLYSGTESTGKTVDISTAVADYGLIRGSIMTHESGAYDHHIYWDVSGNELKNCTTAYIRYDASGNGSDSWNKNAISVDLTVIKKIDNLANKEISLDQEITVTDTGVFGLAARDHDQVDLSKYSNYMNADYVFMFDVTLNMSEKNDGYQEIYLYNKFDVTTSDDKKTLAYAREHGLVWATNLVLAPSKIETTATNNYFNWAITGNNIADTMYIRYDAHGDNADTWYKHSMTITLKIFYAPSYTPDESVLDVLI